MIEKTGQEFSDLADISIDKSQQKHYVVTISAKKEIDPERLRKEFANYCLQLSKSEINTSAFRNLG